MDQIVPIDEVPDDSTFLFRVRETGNGIDSPEDDDEREAILLEADEGVVAWLNYCQHFTHIKLDKGSGASMRNGEIVCRNHGAMFEADSGVCTFGPCEGAYLEDLAVTVEDGDVYLTDPDYEFVATGPVETDPLDLTSRSHVEF